MSADNKDIFDLKAVNDFFKTSIKDEDDILIEEYLNSYSELNKFFTLMGTVFGFVSSDLESKIVILNELLAKDSDHFRSVKSMIDHEKENDLLHKKNYTSGSRTLLRLHRGLDFIREFLRKISDLENSVNTAPACREAYNATLAKHHPFYIRGAAKTAMYALPTRDQLLLKICGTDTSVIETVNVLPETLVTIDDVFNRIETLYTLNDLHALP